MAATEIGSEMSKAVGDAIIRWQHVEIALFHVFCAVTRIENLNISSAIFHSPVNFQTKLKMTDSAAQIYITDPKLLDIWKKIAGKIKDKNEIRNNIAHFMVIHYSDKLGSFTSFMQPNIVNIYPSMSKKMSEKKYRISDIVAHAKSFGDLSLKIESFSEYLYGRKTPWLEKYFPELS